MCSTLPVYALTLDKIQRIAKSKCIEYCVHDETFARICPLLLLTFMMESVFQKKRGEIKEENILTFGTRSQCHLLLKALDIVSMYVRKQKHDCWFSLYNCLFREITTL